MYNSPASLGREKSVLPEALGSNDAQATSDATCSRGGGGTYKDAFV